MYYEVTSKRVVVDPKGNDKEISERFIVVNCELFGEAEMKTLQEYNGENDVVVSMNQSGTQATVIASGTTVGFIEFGTGVRYPEWDNSGMDYTPPKHGTYGKGKGASPHGWWFTATSGQGASQHTYGNMPAEAMLTARDRMIEQVVKIAREVWK